ncbi:putative ubiquitin carboxyl-terminal hydrolase 24 [Apostichopus japonicus]|uniref:Putative ubiquitin carboxyl-terminal hydrolase 24 n=1 Tax=Stichopus japonicus TaxID=307972 RepID=A0A2G8LKZ0_STIJA|nr:putative ubiquitin carboxyl-terminal hydrolase 24 [Apostichopus japonicus]
MLYSDTKVTLRVLSTRILRSSTWTMVLGTQNLKYSTRRGEDPSAAITEVREESVEDANKFPVTNLYELQSRVFTDQWSIPYKKEESLGKCLIAAIKMAQNGKHKTLIMCRTSIDQWSLYIVRNLGVRRKLRQLCSTLLARGYPQTHDIKRCPPLGLEIHEGIYNMLQMVVDLVAARLKYKPIPIELLELLALVFNPDTEYHYKNRNKQWERIRWEGVFGVNKCFAVPPPPVTYKEQCGWLVNLVNQFAELGGIDMIKQIMMENPEDLDPSTMTVLLKPLGAAADYLNAIRIVDYLSDLEKVVLKFIADLKDNDLKQKKAGNTSILLSTLKKLILNFWIEDVKEIDNLRLQLALRMLKSPHFNARMNSLKEIAKLIEDSPSNSKNAIEEKVLLDWLVEKKVLSIALEGNIDQTQYCDKLKVIVEFIGSKLSAEELTKIWKMQNDQPLTVVDNIHDIMAAAAIKFNDEHWNTSSC